MGRAGGGRSMGGGRSFGGGRSMGSRRFGGRSSGGRSFGGGGRSSFSGGIGSHGPGPSHHHHHHHHHRPYGSILFGPRLGRRTIIINNNGGSGHTGTYTQNGEAAQRTVQNETYTAPKPLTPEQKINRAEALAKEAGQAKKGMAKMLVAAALVVCLGLFLRFASKQAEPYQKAELGVVYAGYATDEINGASGTRETVKACEAFYEDIGIPLYFYTVANSAGDTAEDMTLALYDRLFKDEAHVLFTYYDADDMWYWCVGEAAASVMPDSEINALLDEIYENWYNYNLSYDEVIARGVNSYRKELLDDNSGAKGMSGIVTFIGIVLAVIAVISYISKDKEEKQYAEEAKTLRTEEMLKKPLETFGNQDVEDLKEKYDNM